MSHPDNPFIRRFVPVIPQKAKIGKLARFGIVGVLSTLAYMAITNALVASGTAGPALAAGVGYLVVVPINYLMHRSFSFRSSRSHRSAGHRYLLVHMCNIAGTMGVMHVVTSMLHLDYRIGIVLTAVLVPVAVFVLLDRWVFPPTRDTSPDDPNP